MRITRGWVVTRSETGLSTGKDDTRRVVMLVPKKKGWRYAADQVSDLDRLLNPHSRKRSAPYVPDGVRKRDIYIPSQPFCIRAQLSTIMRSGEGEGGEFLAWQPDGYAQVLMDFKTGDVEFRKHEFPVMVGLWDRAGPPT
jgi:hypothetical protein